MRYYDSSHDRLVYIQQQANPNYWDNQWQPEQLQRSRLLATKWTYVVPITQKYLPPTAGPVLEGGCGQGIHVAALQNNGYTCMGVDFAPRTVQTLNDLVPELDIRQGDVRHLPFADATFAGYWSVGVIEHFWEGYAAIALEMKRVLRPDGLLFLTFPYLSPLRRWKIRRHAYPILPEDAAREDFYQFALNYHQVLEQFRQLGFELVATKPLDGLKGLKDEISWGRQSLQRWYSYRGKSAVVRGSRYMVTNLIAPVTAHSILLVLRRGHGEG